MPPEISPAGSPLDRDTALELARAINRLADVQNESHPNGPAPDGGRYAAALDGAKAVSDQFAVDADAREFAAQKAERARIDAIVRDIMKDTRDPSLAKAIGTGSRVAAETRLRPGSVIKANAALDAAFVNYQSGEIFDALGAFAAGKQFMDVELANEAKAKFAELGMWHAEAPQVPGGYKALVGPQDMDATNWAKATTGATGATGGYVLPNNLVDTLVKPATMKAIYQNLVTTVNGVAVRGVDQPFRTGAPARMQFQDWNTSKENVNEAYGSYTATLGTMARVMDITKQYARFSAGAAERDVMDELTRAAILGENYYVIAGAGTGTVGSGDPTKGVYTSLNAAGQVQYSSSFASASNSTVAGSFAAACSTLLQKAADSNREFTAIVVDNTTYFTATRQGNDSAGFWASELLGAGFTFGSNVGQLGGGALAYRGIPIYWDSNLGTNATTKIAIGAQWDVFKLYRGLEFRIDSTDVAGTRWDYNLIGYRGEQEIGFNADTGVLVGAAYLLKTIIS